MIASIPIQQPTIRLGLLAPLSGLVELYGSEISRAGQVACDEVNEAGGVLGQRLELVIANDGSLPETAVPAAHRLIDDMGCVAIIGNLLSNSRIAVSNLVSDPRKIPYLNFSFYEGSISSRYFFHFAALPNQQIDRMIPSMADRFGPKMYFAGSNYEWPRGSIDAGKRALTAYGGEIVGEDYLPIGTQDVDELLNRVGKSGADVFVPYFAGSDQVNLLTRFTELGLKSHIAVVMGHYDEAMVGSLSPDVREGFYSSNTYFMSIDTEANRRYLDRLRRLPDVSGIWPDGNGVLTNFGEGTYLCVHAFAQAANAAGSVDAEDLVEALETVWVCGPQGRVEMNPENHHATVNTYLSRCRSDGSFEIVETFGRIPPIIPERYREEGNVAESSTPNIVREPLGVCIVDTDGSLAYVNDRFRDILGFDNSSRLLTSSVLDLCDTGSELHAIINSDSTNHGPWSCRVAVRTTGGQARRIDITAVEMVAADSQRFGFTLSCVDTGPDWTVPVVGNAAPYDQILATADVAIIATSEDGTIIQANECASSLFGFSLEELVGLSVHILVPPRFRSNHKRHVRGFASSPQMAALMGGRGQIAGYRKDGSEFPAEAGISKIRAGDEWVFVATVRDVTEIERAKEDLLWLATHDPLTQLPNRSLISERIVNALARSRRSHSSVVLLFVDMDRFKLVNDSYGHDIGDKILVAMADRLVDIVRPGDTVARFGGDEFLILSEQVQGTGAASPLAERVVEAMRQPLIQGELDVFITVSVGIAVGQGETHKAEDMLRMADAAMYLAKDCGRDRWQIYNDEIHERAKQQLDIANGLRKAIEQDELDIVVQPIVDMVSERTVGGEVLLRWRAEKGSVSPSVFVPIAEMTGSIISIGRWVFEQACALQVEWDEMAGPEVAPYVSVNVSARQLGHPGLVDEFSNILNASGADATRMLLEITETSLMTDVDANMDVLRQLGELGMKIAVDDFGTGYSSLSQLMAMPVDSLKIDRLFVHGIESKEGSTEIIRAITDMAHALGLVVVAEGVETNVQLETLRELGCDRAQGYLFHRPMSMKNLARQLFHHRERPRVRHRV